ncbi:MAG: hypothetical protein ACLFVQ_10070 [Chitinispirillaceae bacterium]
MSEKNTKRSITSSFFRFYRFYTAILVSTFLSILLGTFWIFLPSAVLIRFIWHKVERASEDKEINRLFEQHAPEFKQLAGPYGIRLINKAENDSALRRSLAEVFTPDENKLKEAVEQLEMLDTLFRAGMTPDGDSYQLHDLKLKYGRHRLEALGKKSS